MVRLLELLCDEESAKAGSVQARVRAALAAAEAAAPGLLMRHGALLPHREGTDAAFLALAERMEPGVFAELEEVAKRLDRSVPAAKRPKTLEGADAEALDTLYCGFNLAIVAGYYTGLVVGFSLGQTIAEPGVPAVATS